MICSRVVVEHIEKRLHIDLREYTRRAEDRMGGLWVERWCVVRVSRDIVFGLLRVDRLGSIRVTPFQKLVNFPEVIHTVRSLLLYRLKRCNKI